MVARVTISFQQVAVYSIGIVSLSLGVATIVHSGLGVGAWEAFNIGLSYRTGLSIGVAYFLSGLVLIAATALLSRARPDFLALATSTLIGVTVNEWLKIVGLAFGQSRSLSTNVVLFVLGLLVTSTGVAIYLASGIGRSPVDGLMLAIRQRWRTSIGMAKTLDSLLGLVLALLLGGPTGWGTLVFTLTLGPLIDPQYKIVSRFLNSNSHSETK